MEEEPEEILKDNSIIEIKQGYDLLAIIFNNLEMRV